METTHTISLTNGETGLTQKSLLFLYHKVESTRGCHIRFGVHADDIVFDSSEAAARLIDCIQRFATHGDRSQKIHANKVFHVIIDDLKKAAGVGIVNCARV